MKQLMYSLLLLLVLLILIGKSLEKLDTVNDNITTILNQ